MAGFGWRKAVRKHDLSEEGLDPFPFHIANVALHAAVTGLVYALALRLIGLRDAWARPAPPKPYSGVHAEAAAGSAAAAAQSSRQQREQKGDASAPGLRQRRGSAAAAQPWQQGADRLGTAAGARAPPAQCLHHIPALAACLNMLCAHARQALLLCCTPC